MSPGRRAPVWPSRPRAERACRSTPRPAAAASPSRKRGARRRVDLGLVMHLDDFDIETFVQRLRDALDQRGQQVDAEAHIAGLHHHGARGDALDHGHVGRRQAGGSDDVDEAALGGDRDIGDGRGRHGEIQNAVGIGRQRPQIGRELDAVLRQAGEHAGILAQQFRARRFQRAGQTAPGVSEMTRTSARPIRPPAPATINRISAMAHFLHAL